jgi:uncharacterized membrane protein YeaQ/YmgE (transglycosylase-associated protein family)
MTTVTKTRKTTKTVIGILGTIVLGTIGSLLANFLWGSSIRTGFRDFIYQIQSFLTYRVPVWGLLLIISAVVAVLMIFRSRKFLVWHANLVLKRKRRKVPVVRYS